MKENDKFLGWGYKAAIILSFLGLIGAAIYLFTFQLKTIDPEYFENEVRLLGLTADMQMRLLSTGIFVGMSFGFLGFALFLIQAKGSVDLNGESGNHKIKIANLSPGLFVILCATVIVVMASTYQIKFNLESSPGNSGASDPVRKRDKYELPEPSEKETETAPQKPSRKDTSKVDKSRIV